MTRKTIGGNRIPVEIDELADGVEFPVSINDVAPGFEVPVTVNSTDVLRVTSADDAAIDAFARQRFTQPSTTFESKQIFNNNLVGENNPLFWDNQQVSGSGTTTQYVQNEAATKLSVSANTAGKRVRQTRMRLNYQPGKSQLVIMTFADIHAEMGITKRIGQFDNKNGLFLQYDNGVAKVGIRSFYTGVAVDRVAPQSEWNVDKLDGTGKSGLTVDWSKSQILFFDYEWLGVGRVRFGLFINGLPYYFHEFLNTNNLQGVYMSTPNLPIRYEIENDGTGAADTLTTICTTVISEGGFDKLGTFRTVPPSIWATNVINANTIGTTYLLQGLRLNDSQATIDIVSYTTNATSVDDYIVSLHFNPTYTATLTWVTMQESHVDYALGPTTNPGVALTSPGYVFASQVVSSQIKSVTETLENAVRLGANIAGTPDEIWVCVTPLGVNLDIIGAATWRELQ